MTILFPEDLCFENLFMVNILSRVIDERGIVQDNLYSIDQVA